LFKRLVGAIATIAAGSLFIAGIGIYVASAKNDDRVLKARADGTMVTSKGTLPHFTLEMQVYPDSMFGGKGPMAELIQIGLHTGMLQILKYRQTQQ